MNAIYNEIEPFAADWLEQLIARDHIAPGCVERRSIADLTAADVAGPGQRHFFAGIGGWSYALRLAGVPDGVSVWTGSCPCQPFSDAGKGGGVLDPRHLWPAWFELIRECRPAAIFGEQVASRAGLAWFDLVRADLEGCGYAVGASDLCAASVGAPHIRQRLYFVAHANTQHVGQRVHVQPRRPRLEVLDASRGRANSVSDGGQLGHASSSRSGRDTGAIRDEEAQGESQGRVTGRERDELEHAGADGRVGDPSGTRLEGGDGGDGGESRPDQPAGDAKCAGPELLADSERHRSGTRRIAPSHGLPTVEPDRHSADGWSPCDWIACTDGVSRPVEPGTFPLAHGVSGRVVVRRAAQQGDAAIQEEHWYNRAGALAGYGNAIVPQVAAAFIEAAMTPALEIECTCLSAMAGEVVE